MNEYNIGKDGNECVCELKNIAMSPVCDQPFEPCSADLHWCSNIGKDGAQCAHDEACHQLTNKAHTAQGEI